MTLKVVVSFLIKDYELLKKYNKVLNKVWNTIRKGFYNEPVFNEYLKTKTEPFIGKMNANSHDNGIPKEGSHCIFL